MDQQVPVPYAYTPRRQQVPVWDAMRTKRRAFLVWHRRYGKDKTCLNFTIAQAVQRVGLYAYIFPEFAQGRRVLWEGIDKTGFRFRDHFHPSFVARRKDSSLDMDEQEMRVRLRSGSIVQIFGSDEYDRLRGMNPIGVVNTEYAYQDPRAWDVVRPILAENGGWCIFNTTPNGKNHAWELWENARRLDSWFTQKLTVDDTTDEFGQPIVSQAILDEERALGMPEELIQQEYYCSFEAGQHGSYYGTEMERAESEGRIGRVPWEPVLPVYTCWDLGMNDVTAIWFYQRVGREIRWIDYYENSGEGLPHYAKVLRERPYAYGRHDFPFDMAVRELNNGKSRLKTAWELGLRPANVVQKLDPEDGIEAVRKILPRSYWDAEKCKHGVKALKAYHKEWDEKARAFKRRPKHDWASNAADAFRVGAVGMREDAPTDSRPSEAETRYDVLNRFASPPADTGARWGHEFRPRGASRPLWSEAIR